MKIISNILAAILVVGVLSGCAKANNAATGAEVGKAKYGSEYPIKSETKLTFWMPMTANISTSAANFGDLPVAKELEKRTGIKVQYIHPSLTNREEKFNLMIASGELADIIEYPWTYYNGGPGKAIEDNIILPLNDYVDAFAPNLKSIYEKNPHIRAEAKTDNGYYFSSSTIALNDRLLTSGGLIIRQDWLDDLGLSMPETIDEWYTVLKAFKEQKGATAPLAIGNDAFIVGAFTGAFGFTLDFYRDGNTIHYGPAEPAFKEFLTTMHQWYSEGLFDNNFSTTDAATRTANMLNGNTGVVYGGLGGGIGALISAATDPNFKVAGAPYPTHQKGVRPMFGQATPPVSPEAAISTKCKDAELAMKFLDYGYSEEGSMFFNFGTEGETYTMKDGYPTYTELITKNPDGLSMSQALAKYSKGGQGGSFIQDVRYLEQYAGRPEQQSAWNSWIDTDGQSHRVPLVYIKEEKNAEYATKMTDVQTHWQEMLIKFISGIEPLENFDTYLETVKSMGADDLIAMKQEAYNNFLKR